MKIDFNKIENPPYPRELEDYFSAQYLNRLGINTDKTRYKYQKDSNLLSLDKFEELKVRFKKDLIIPSDVENPKDFQAYLFNSQTKIDLTKNNTVVIIDNVEVPINLFNLDKNGKSGSVKHKLTPPPFDDNDYINWTLKTNNTCKKIKLKRVEHNSAYTKKYEFISIPLKVDLFINKNDDISITIKTILEQNNTHVTVSSILESLDIQIAFYKKELLINDIKISNIAPNSEEFGSEEVRNEIQGKYNYWSKVKKLEEKLDSSFKIDFPMKSDDVLFLDEMLVSLILDESFRESYNITKINLKFNSIQDARDFENSLKEGSKASVSWKEYEKINLFSTNKNLIKFYSISNFYVDSITIKENPNVEMTIIVREIENEKMNITSKYILNNESDISMDLINTSKYLIEYQEQLLSE